MANDLGAEQRTRTFIPLLGQVIHPFATLALHSVLYSTQEEVQCSGDWRKKRTVGYQLIIISWKKKSQYQIA